MEIGNIIKGTANGILGINKEISQKRLQICYSCPLYSKKLGGICNNKLYLNILTGEISTEKKEGFKNGCGCKLIARTRMVNAKCPLGKW